MSANRVTAVIARVQSRIEAADPAEMVKLEAEMAVTFEEHLAYQEAQAQAHASGTLTSDEAQVVYQALGEVGSESNGGWAAGTGLATKVAVTMLVGELLSRRLGCAAA